MNPSTPQSGLELRAPLECGGSTPLWISERAGGSIPSWACESESCVKPQHAKALALRAGVPFLLAAPAARADSSPTIS